MGIPNISAVKAVALSAPVFLALTVDKIVAYNPHLILKYDFHINAEICAPVTSLNHLYNYIFESHDVALIQVRCLTVNR